MADKKTAKVVKKTAVKVPKNEKNLAKRIADLRSYDLPALHEVLATAKADLLEAQKSLAANELANPKVVNKMRKEIARIKTIIAAKVAEEKSNNDKKEEEK
jgi:ribosomal protein L29